MGDLNNKLEQIKAIKNGKGIQYILDAAYKILGNPALIFDMDYKLIACPDGVVNDDPIWIEFMAYGRLGNETIEFFKNEGFIESVANCTNFDGVTYLISNKLKYDRIFGQLNNNSQISVADLVAVACDKPFDDDIPVLIKALCDVLSKELGKSDYYQNYGQTYQENIIKNLIEGGIEDKGIYTGHVANIDKGLKTNIYVAVARIAQSDSTDPKLVYFRELFKQTQPDFKYSIYVNYIVFFISSDNTMLNIEKDLKKLIEIFEQNNIYVGISSNFENLFESQRHYIEAVNALNHGLNSNNKQRIFLHDGR